MVFNYKIQFIRKLLKTLPNFAGRNNTGQIVNRHRGGGVFKRYRRIDFKRVFLNIPFVILRTEYDPYRNANILLIFYLNGYFSYILSPFFKARLYENFFINSFFSEIKIGNSLALRNIPVGTLIYNIELYPGQGGVLGRSAGTFGQILFKNFNDTPYVLIRLKSSEEYLINENCFASIGVVSNLNYNSIIWRKAGKSRYLNRRPHVRGVAMNPVDHPHGGGEGKTSGGRPSVSYTGKLTKGLPTRKKNKVNNKIYKSRKYLKKK